MKVIGHWALLLLSLGLLVVCGRKDVDRKGRIKLRGESPVSLNGKREGALLQRGTASWYGKPYHGRRTANGETYDMWAMTAAHKSLPFNSVVRVVNQENGKSVRVRINDRGPFIKGRIIDLSRRAARRLDLEATGIADVALFLVKKPGDAKSGNTKSAEVASGNGYWTIQVGSFGERRNARAFAEKMKRYSDAVAVEKSGAMHRVRVGRFTRKIDAARLAESLYEDDVPVWVVFIAR